MNIYNFIVKSKIPEIILIVLPLSHRILIQLSVFSSEGGDVATNMTLDHWLYIIPCLILYIIILLGRAEINSYIIESSDFSDDRDMISKAENSKLFKLYYNGFEEISAKLAAENTFKFSNIALNFIKSKKIMLIVVVTYLLLVFPSFIPGFVELDHKFTSANHKEVNSTWYTTLIYEFYWISNALLFFLLLVGVFFFVTFVISFRYLGLNDRPTKESKIILKSLEDQSPFIDTFVKHTIKSFRRASKVIVDTFIKWAIIIFIVLLGLDFAIFFVYDIEDADFVFQVSILIANILVIGAIMIGFIYPQLIPKATIQSEKVRLLNMIEALYNIKLHEYFKIANDQSSTYEQRRTLAEELNFLDIQAEKVQQVLVWPFNYSQLIALLSSAMVPLLTALWPLVNEYF